MAKPMTAAEWKAALTKWQVPVKYYPGWDTRGRPGDFTDINGVVIHHTGSDEGQSDAYLKFLFVDGRASEGIPGPLCHSAADMDGDLWMGAIGRANHAGRGNSGTLSVVVNEDYRGFSAEIGPGPDNTDGNAHFYGCEVRYDGGQPMTPKQYAAATRWAAAICHHYGWSALSVIGHREWTARKNDPGCCPMYKFRADVAALLKAGPPTKAAPVGTPTVTSGGTMSLTSADLTAIRAAVQAELEEYGKRLFGDGGSAGEAIQRADAFHADATNRLIRIEADTDAAFNTGDGTIAEPKPA